MSESDNESEIAAAERELTPWLYVLEKLKEMEHRLIALERALEAVLTKIEDAEHPQAHGHDQPGWFGVTE